MIKWFSGGKDRANSAIELLKKLNNTFYQDSDFYMFNKLIEKYIATLKSPDRPVPYILNSFNLEISKLIRQNSVKLSEDQSNLLKEIRSLSNIRYGYSI